MDSNSYRSRPFEIRDYGGEPLVVNMNRFARMNRNFRTALWTGKHLQVTLMSIPVGEDIGLEFHPDVDQFIRIESGYARVMMGDSKEHLDYQQRADADDAIMIPAGTWHNVINIGSRPLKAYSIYVPPQHPFGTVHQTKQEAEQEEAH